MPSHHLPGWDDGWAAALAAVLADPDQRPARAGWLDRTHGRVVRADRRACDVLSENGLLTTPWGAALSALVAHDPTTVPAAGDWVVVASWPDGRHTAEQVLPRRTSVIRAQVAAGSSFGQVLAANVDVVAVVEGMVPAPDLGRIERLLALAWSSGARPAVVLTKADAVPQPQDLLDDVRALAPGADVLAVSATADTGLDPLRQWLSGGATIALLGASGVGKSTLLNALAGAEVMATRELGAVNKGRHTTVTRELHAVPGGGAVLDPGLRSIGLLGSESLDEVFPDVEALALACRFQDCAHGREPGCAVLAAVESGELPERRLASYRKLLREREYQASRVDARLRTERGGRWKSISRRAKGRSRP